MKCIFTKRTFAIVLLCFLFPLLWGQNSAQENSYRQIDAAVQEKSPQKLAAVLKAGSKEAFYPQLESYTLKKARQLIVDNELDFARRTVLAVIDNNLDNFEAVDLYISINAAIEKRDAQRAAAQEKQQVEELKQEASDARIKNEAPKEYKSVTNTASGETVYLDQDFGSHYLPFSWQAALGFIDIGLLYNNRLDTKYGLSAGASFYYYGEKYTAGGDLFSDIMLLTFKGGQSVSVSVQAIAQAAWIPLNRNLFGRLGFAAYFSDMGIENVAASAFLTPVIGIGAREIRFGKVLFDAHLDYYPGHFAYPGMYAAFEAGAAGSIIIADLDEIDISLNAGIKNAAFIRDTGLNNQTRVFISIGVGNND